MTRSRANEPAPLPTREQLLRFIGERGGRVDKREIGRAFNVRAADRGALRALLKDLVDQGAVERGPGRGFRAAAELPQVGVVEIIDTDVDGEVYARPVAWRGEAAAPRIVLVPDRRLTRTAPGIGERVLARLTKIEDGLYEARAMRLLGTARREVLGVYEVVGGRGRLRPTDRKLRQEYDVSAADSHGAEPGEVVLAEAAGGRRKGLPCARITERLGHMGAPRSFSLIAMHTHGIRASFDERELAAAAVAKPAPPAGRADLTDIPLITIDPDDARDFDDAVWAEPDPSPDNPGGWHILVAIADVAHFVTPDSVLDRAARERGFSVYFPDRVVPMLPEALSSDLCSLKPGEPRSCLAVHLWFDSSGRKRRHTFVRAIMRSAARLTYRQMADAHQGRPDADTGPLADTVIAPLYAAYDTLTRARTRRQPLDIALPEREVRIGPDGRIAAVSERQVHDSNKLIEELMIQANVAAAESLEAAKTPCMYRVHEPPDRERVAALSGFLATLGYRLPRGETLRPALFNRVLTKARGKPHDHLVNEVILRCQARALYDPDNLGHFGLNLKRYAHFTSPIRRYADLLVHRALISALGLGAGGLGPEASDFAVIGEHISAAERRATAAEREALDRFTAAYMADRVGGSFTGRISGVSRFGLFVALPETGAEGIVPMRLLADDYYRHDEAGHALVGRATSRRYRLGDLVEVRLAAADSITGSLLFELVADRGLDPLPSPRRGRPPKKRVAARRQRR